MGPTFFSLVQAAFCLWVPSLPLLPALRAGGAQAATLLPCRAGAAHPPVQVPEERQSDVLRPEDHEEGSLAVAHNWT